LHSLHCIICIVLYLVKLLCVLAHLVSFYRIFFERWNKITRLRIVLNLYYEWLSVYITYATLLLYAQRYGYPETRAFRNFYIVWYSFFNRLQMYLICYFQAPLRFETIILCLCVEVVNWIVLFLYLLLFVLTEKCAVLWIWT